ncbi:MAG: hypothetical protein RLZ98_2681 [Pseudomonadota bacterium]|jgi:L-threonylcarbamoyladenylate synthase
MAIVPVSTDAIAAAAAALRAGALVAFPTETVYGLGADASNGEAVARIYAAKGRPTFNPLIVHVASIEAAMRIGAFSALAERLAAEFWPGPLTLVVKLRPDAAVSSLVTAGLDTVGIRVPDHPVAHRLLAAADLPVAAPSANRSGHVSPTTAQHVYDDLGEVPAFIIDGGPTAHGLESTVLDATSDRLVELRPGALERNRIEAVIGVPVEIGADEALAPQSPGMLASHYAPRAQLRLDAQRPEPGEALLAFGPLQFSVEGPVLNLSESGDLIEAAAALFAALRKLDATGLTRIAVMPIPNEGLGIAINDRLRRAAAPR